MQCWLYKLQPRKSSFYEDTLILYRICRCILAGLKIAEVEVWGKRELAPALSKNSHRHSWGAWPSSIACGLLPLFRISPFTFRLHAKFWALRFDIIFVEWHGFWRWPWRSSQSSEWSALADTTMAVAMTISRRLRWRNGVRICGYLSPIFSIAFGRVVDSVEAFLVVVAGLSLWKEVDFMKEYSRNFYFYEKERRCSDGLVFMRWENPKVPRKLWTRTLWKAHTRPWKVSLEMSVIFLSSFPGLLSWCDELTREEIHLLCICIFILYAILTKSVGQIDNRQDLNLNPPSFPRTA